METSNKYYQDPQVRDWAKRLTNIKSFFKDVNDVCNSDWMFNRKKHLKDRWYFDIREYANGERFELTCDLSHPAIKKPTQYTFVYDADEIYKFEFDYTIHRGEKFRRMCNPLLSMPALEVTLRIKRIKDWCNYSQPQVNRDYFDGLSGRVDRWGWRIAKHLADKETVNTNFMVTHEDKRMEGGSSTDTVWRSGGYGWQPSYSGDWCHQFGETPNQTIYHYVYGCKASYHDTLIWPFKPVVKYDEVAQRCVGRNS